MISETGERDARARAVNKALAMGGAAAVRRERYGMYKVASATRPGTFHTVAVDKQGRYRCTCEAGLQGRACWHQAAVLIAKMEHAGGVRVTGPAQGSAPQAEAPSNVVAFPQRRVA